jgi:hypothetical protein
MKDMTNGRDLMLKQVYSRRCESAESAERGSLVGEVLRNRCAARIEQRGCGDPGGKVVRRIGEWPSPPNEELRRR